jgi:erythromycin esterase-like protein
MVSMRRSPTEVVASLRAGAWPWVAGKSYERVLSWVGEASIVLLGAATYGTHDFYAARAALTRQLIEEGGFGAVAVEADWCDAYTISRYAQGFSGAEPTEVLAGFDRFPSWLWRNTAMAEFAAWLHELNAARPHAGKVGFYGLDLFSLNAAMRSMADLLGEIDPLTARAAAAALSGYDHFNDGGDGEPWTAIPPGDTAAGATLVRELAAVRERCGATADAGRRIADDEAFYDAQQRAAAPHAEDYYRTVLAGPVLAWNARTRHMAEMLDALRAMLVSNGRSPRIVVWAHNAHVGDARASDFRAHGRTSLGQLVRQRYGIQSRLVGMTSYAGQVVAVSGWGEPAEIKPLLPAMVGSAEELLHRIDLPRFFLPLPAGSIASDVMSEPLPERALGLVYHPEQERWAHYLPSTLAGRYDAVLHVDDSQPLEPLESLAEWTDPQFAKVAESPTG